MRWTPQIQKKKKVFLENKDIDDNKKVFFENKDIDDNMETDQWVSVERRNNSKNQEKKTTHHSNKQDCPVHARLSGRGNIQPRQDSGADTRQHPRSFNKLRENGIQNRGATSAPATNIDMESSQSLIELGQALKKCLANINRESPDTRKPFLCRNRGTRADRNPRF